MISLVEGLGPVKVDDRFLAWKEHQLMLADSLGLDEADLIAFTESLGNTPLPSTLEGADANDRFLDTFDAAGLLYESKFGLTTLLDQSGNRVF